MHIIRGRLESGDLSVVDILRIVCPSCLVQGPGGYSALLRVMVSDVGNSSR